MEALQLTPSLQPAHHDQAVAVLRHYFAPMTADSGFTGGQWDTFDPSGNRAATADEITAEDLLSLALLSVDIPAKAALLVLSEPMRSRASELLRRLPTDRDLVEISSLQDEDFAAAWELDKLLRTLPGVGATRAAKLVARKRPRLVPVYDSIIRKTLTDDTGIFWVPLHNSLRADDRGLHRHLVTLHQDAQLSPDVTPLRVLDVLAWMDGTDFTDRVIRSHSGDVAVAVEQRQRAGDDFQESSA